MIRFGRLFSTARLQTQSKQTLTKIQQDSEVLLQLYDRPPLIFTHGKGCYLYDLDGKEYLDLGAGIAVNALGHNNDQVVDALTTQAKKLIHLSNLYHNEHAGVLARQLIDLYVNNNKSLEKSKVFFCNSGTEANEAAIKFARKFGKQINKEKFEIVSFKNAFHGRTLGALAATPAPKYQEPFEPMLPGFTSVPLNDIQAADDAITDKTCGIIIEPIQGEGGIHLVDFEFIKFLQEKADSVGALLIMDEIQCGLGRTGKVFAHQHYPELAPDITTMAKPLANGVPIGATIVSEKVAASLKPGDHGTTFGGNPLATRVAQVVLSQISSPQFLKNVQENGEYFKSELQEIALASPLITQVRGKGLMIGIQLRESVASKLFVDLARDLNLLVIAAGSNTIRIVPPLNITKEQIDKSIVIIEKVIEEMERIVVRG